MKTKITIIAIGIAIASIAIFVFTSAKNPVPTVNENVYMNKDYGFSFFLPESWKGYSVTIDTWTGNQAGDQLGEVASTKGPVVSIHNPKWSGSSTYQDIPIMIFTLSQWDELMAGKFHIGAAPINPSELARNEKYVFALLARYNYGFPPGYEEVERILQSNPLKVFAPEL